MTTILDEVPGARERPGRCPVQIGREENGTVTLVIPPRGVSPIVLFFACVLLLNLLLTLYTGLVLTLTGRSVLFMAQISPSGLPYSLRHWQGALLLGLLLTEALGFWTLAAILRPITARDWVEISGDWVRVRHSEWGRGWERRLARRDVRGFLLRRIPLGLDSGTLTVEGRGEEIEIGEFLREADREWLVSAGNSLLNRSAQP